MTEDFSARYATDLKAALTSAHNANQIMADALAERDAEIARMKKALQHITDIEPDPDNMERFHDIAHVGLGTMANIWWEISEVLTEAFALGETQ